MKRKRIIRDRKILTLAKLGNGTYTTVNGKRCIVYSRRKGYAVTMNIEKEKYGLVNIKNQTVIHNKYDMCTYPQRGIIFVMKKDLWGFADETGKLLCPCEYTHIYSFKGDVAITRRGTSYGLITKKGEVILKCKYCRETVLYERRRHFNKM